jgi:hypothetical protein
MADPDGKVRNENQAKITLLYEGQEGIPEAKRLGWDLEDPDRSTPEPKGRLETISQKKTVLETDTGGWVRKALRLKANESKGTRPIRSVTSGEGELA